MPKNAKSRSARKPKNQRAIKRANKIKQQHKTSRPSAPRRSRRGAATPGNITKVCSLIDPFCAKAAGTKFPDGAANRSITYTSEAFVNLGADANGIGCVAFPLNPSDGPRQMSTEVGGGVTAWASPTGYDGMASFPAGTQYRVVSAGIQVDSILPSNSNQGMIGVLSVEGEDYLPNQLVSPSLYDIGSTSYNANVRQPMNTAKGLLGIAYAASSAARSFKNFDGLSGTVSSFVNTGFDVLVAYVVGAPANAVSCATVRYVINYELSFPIKSSYNHIATPARPLDSNLISTSGKVHSQIEQVIVGGVKDVEKYVSDTAATWLSDAVGLAGTFLGDMF